MCGRGLHRSLQMKNLLNLMYIVILICLSSKIYAFENKYTHPAITKEAVNNTAAQIDSYLKNELGIGE
jgi:hypothetical protein